MTLTVVIGRAGSGKTTYIRDLISNGQIKFPYIYLDGGNGKKTLKTWLEDNKSGTIILEDPSNDFPFIRNRDYDYIISSFSLERLRPEVRSNADKVVDIEALRAQRN